MRALKLVGGALLAFFTAMSACDRGPSESGVAEEKGGDKGSERASAAGASSVERVPLIGAKIRGNKAALVTIVEISDYACPFCAKAHAVVESLMKEYEGQLRLAVLENPLPFHTTAKPAARWVFAAGEQGKYWEARDILFAHQKQLDEAGLGALARELGLDPERLVRDQASRAAEQYVQTGLDLARSLGVKGTPTFFINGVRLIGAQPAEKFRAAIDAALEDAQGMVARGVRPEDVYAEILKSAPPPGAVPPPEPVKAGRDGCGAGCDDDAKPGAAPEDDGKVYDVEVGDVPTRGPANAPVTIVAFMDLECPFCQKADQTVRALEKEYGQKIRVAYRSFPLPFHEHARLAAKASLAAHRQGKFFEYKDALFARQDNLGREALMAAAKDVGLDERRFAADLDDPAIERAVAADEAQVERLQVRGTPSFFINGRKVVGARPIEELRAKIDAALAGK